MKVFNEDGAIFAVEPLTTDLNADVGTNNNERSLAVGSLPHLPERALVVGDGAMICCSVNLPFRYNRRDSKASWGRSRTKSHRGDL